MNKNEKIIMGILVGGIVIFLALSIIVLFGKGNKEDKSDTTPVVTSATTKDGRVITYPTLPPIVNMTIMINERRFNPDVATIKKGGFVDFFNVGDEDITIEANDQNSSFLNIGVLEATEDKQVTINTVGTYTFRNKANPKMVGTIIVK